MSAEGRVARNSVWLVFQPLVLNAVSIFAMGYITRTLGAADYGRFTLAFALVQMFTPFSNMGLRSVMVRDIAADRDATESHLARMLGTRSLLALGAVAAMFVATWALGYDSLTIKIAAIASITLVTQSLSTTLQDAFQAHEKMAPVAYSQFVGGGCLTILSCLVLFAGYGVVELTFTYVVGGLITLTVGTWLMRAIARVRIRLDFDFVRKKLLQAAPFFVPNIIAAVGGKIGTVLLSKFAPQASLGYFGAAGSLTDRLVVIGDGICTAIYPTLTVLYQKSQEDAAKLFKRFFEYLVMLALPIAVGTTLLARPIISLVCGKAFEGAAPVLIVSVWGLATTFVTSIQFWTLGALHKERIGARIAIMSTVVCVVCNVVFIPLWAEVGTALASLVSTVLSFILIRRAITTYLLPELIGWKRLSRIVVSVVLMGAAVYPLRHLPVLIAIAAGAATYAGSLIVFGAVSREELRFAVNKILRRR